MKEVTVQVFNSLHEIELALINEGYQLTEKFDVFDWYFSHFSLSECNKLDYKTLIKNSFLIRKFVDDQPKIELCYKIKELDNQNNLINEEKIKTSINSLENALDIFKKSNITNWCTLEDTCYTYQKNSVQLFIQVIKDLGIFIEFEETADMINLNDKEKAELMISTLKDLNLNLGEDFYCKKVFLKFKKS